MTVLLDMSIGPVQGFVAQSRRTRDLWGSSYLLSFLSAHAMRGISQAGGRIVRPSVADDPLYRWVCAAGNGALPTGEPPRIGSVPNHFVAELEGDGAGDPAAVAEAGRRALVDAWDHLCGVIWERFLAAPAALGDGTTAIWARQTASFWEILWTAADSSVSAGLLARRKHWRSHRLPDEPGDKCTLMPDYQELSGLVRAGGRGAREQQDAFWNRLRREVGPLDLRRDERLCSVALVKRLFPRLARAAIGWELYTTRWPSTASVAATPWIVSACRAAPQQAAAFAEAVRRAAPHEARVSPRSIPALAELNCALPGIDANYLQTTFLADERLCPLSDNVNHESRGDLIRQLRELQKVREPGGTALGNASTFYALLLADGDRLGKLVGSLGAATVGPALAAFTAQVPGIVQRHDGVTVYAGGDDVLAMLPVPTALACASALSHAYGEAFRRIDSRAQATLSAALVCAHVRLPLGSVLREAHRLLDDIAKDHNGRDSLAVAVLKRGGLNSVWASTWQRPATAGPPREATTLLNDLVVALARELSAPGLSSALLYRLRDTLSLLCNWPQWGPGVWGELPERLDLRAFLLAELISSLEDQGLKDPGSLGASLTDRILPLLHPGRAADRGGVNLSQVGVDALLLARFLASPSQEDDDS